MDSIIFIYLSRKDWIFLIILIIMSVMRTERRKCNLKLLLTTNRRKCNLKTITNYSYSRTVSASHTKK